MATRCSLSGVTPRRSAGALLIRCSRPGAQIPGQWTSTRPGRADRRTGPDLGRPREITTLSGEGAQMAVAELILIRHGESMGNAAAAAANAAQAEVIVIDQRDADVPLSPAGLQQAQALGAGLREALADERPTMIWSSPYIRAVQTAEVALEAAGVSLPIAVDERLRDRELGVLDLLTTIGVANRFALEAERRRWLGKFYHRPPGGESWADVVLRIRSFLRDIDDVPNGTRAVIICHDALVQLFRYVCERLNEQQVLQIGASDPVKNVSLTQFKRTDGGRDCATLRSGGLLPRGHCQPGRIAVAGQCWTRRFGDLRQRRRARWSAGRFARAPSRRCPGRVLGDLCARGGRRSAGCTRRPAGVSGARDP